MLIWRLLALLCALAPLPLRAQTSPPSFPEGFTGRAQFETTGGFRERGWANLVAARPGAEPCILSVRRLLGPEGGFARQASVAEVPAFVRHIRLDSFSGETQSYFVAGVPIPSPEVDPAQSPIGDLSVFRIHNGGPRGRHVVLARDVPAVGETVWLLTRAGNTLALRNATVVGNRRETWLSVQLSAEWLEQDMSGAPVLNAAGELVGVFSHRQSKDSSTLNLIPAAVIAQVLPQT